MLVVAHGNSLRALIMKLEGLTGEEIVARELATGVPIVYRLTGDGGCRRPARPCRLIWCLTRVGEEAHVLDDAIERLKGDSDERNRWVGVYIGVLAVLLAICSVGGGNAAKDATRANIEASNTWAFFQAKNIRRTAINLAADELELLLAAQPAMSAEARKKFEDKIKDYRAQIAEAHHGPGEEGGPRRAVREGQVAGGGPRRGAAQGPLFRLEPGAAADRHRAGLRAPDHRQHHRCWA